MVFSKATRSSNRDSNNYFITKTTTRLTENYIWLVAIDWIIVIGFAVWLLVEILKGG